MYVGGLLIVENVYGPSKVSSADLVPAEAKCWLGTDRKQLPQLIAVATIQSYDLLAKETGIGRKIALIRTNYINKQKSLKSRWKPLDEWTRNNEIPLLQPKEF